MGPRGCRWSIISAINTVQIAEVSVEKGKLKVHRVSMRCGLRRGGMNPAGVQQQIAGSGIAYSLSAALKGGITIKNRRGGAG